MAKLWLIDGMSVVFRAYHAMLRSGLKSPGGMPSGAVFGFTNILTSLLEREDPEMLAVVFDRHEPTFRHEMYPEYKANRDEFPEELVPQLEKIKELLDLLSIPLTELAGYEADDLIGTLSREAEQKGHEVICVTSDKDFYQLVTEKTNLYKPSGKGGEFDVVDIEGVAKKFGVQPKQVIDVLALIGDSSDNIPGVKGIGEKTAIPLIQEYGNLENLYENLEKIEKKAVRSKLDKDRDIAFLSKELVTIKLDVPHEFDLENCKRKDPNFASLDKFFADIGFRQLRLRWRERAQKKLDESEFLRLKEETRAVSETIENSTNDYRLVDSEEKLDKMIAELSGVELLAFDIETDSLDRLSCEIVGIAFAAEEKKAYYVPVENFESESGRQDAQGDLFSEKKIEGKPKWKSSLPMKETLEKLLQLLENEKIGKCGQNIKFDTYILKRFGVEVKPLVFDSMIASYLLDPQGRHNLDALAKSRLNYEPVPITKLIGEKKSKQISMSELDPAEIRNYACEDADITLRLRNILYEELKKENMLKLANEMEFPLIEVLTHMEYNGVAIDKDALHSLSRQITMQSSDLKKKIFDEAGLEFNIDSPKQLGHVLFEKLMIPPLKKTKTGYSTDIRVLNQLAETYPIANYIIEYRQLEKLRSTYADNLPKIINPLTGRIHTSFNQTVTSTGRLSSTDPNLQNIPIRTTLGKEIRKAFVPGKDGRVIFSADYSQIELRIMAYICGDKHLIDGFKKGHDIHSATAAILFEKDIADVTSDDRRAAKTVNFGIMYGLGSFGLSQRLGIGRHESKEIIDNYFEKYPGIRSYIDMTVEKAREKGYAETLAGRRRYFPDIDSKNHNLRQAAERAAINMPIQGTASDMMKIAMINIHREMAEQNLKSMMIIQVHDELVFETVEEELKKLKQLVIAKMEAALDLGDVPVVVDTGVGKNWFDAH